ACAPGLSCRLPSNASTGKCEAMGGADDPCDNGCAPGLECEAFASDSAYDGYLQWYWLCEPVPGQRGEPCSEDAACAPGLACSSWTWTCEPLPSLGEHCDP